MGARRLTHAARRSFSRARPNAGPSASAGSVVITTTYSTLIDCTHNQMGPCMCALLSARAGDESIVQRLFPSMPDTPEIPRPRLRRADGAEPLRRKSMALPHPQRPLWRRALNYLLMFATAVLLVDAL